MKGINLVVFILFFLCACSQNNKVEESTLDAAEIPIDAIGVLMNSDTLKPPVLVPALPGVRVNAGLPDEHFFAENYGETGGISYMQNYTTDQGLSLDAINFGHKSAICDKAGNLWFATEGGGVSRYDGKSFANFTYASGLASNNVRCVAEDRHGNIWFGTYLGGLSRYDGKSFSNFTTVHGLASDVITSITEDKKGNLWVGTQGGGVSRYDGKSFVNFTTAQGLANDIVLSIAQDNTGNLWFGTYGGGVSRYDGKSFTTFTKKHGLANNFVGSIIADKFGNLWFGSNGKGVTRFDGKEFKVFTTAQGLSYNNILSISEDKEGNIWFGTNGGGVSRFNAKAAAFNSSDTSEIDNTFTNFTTAHGLASNEVRSITEDKTGNLWFGTNGGGLSRYDGKAFTNFTNTQGLANNVVLSIAQDKTGNLWFGTYEGGLSRYNWNSELITYKDNNKKNVRKSFANFSLAQGLPANDVRCIFEDKLGNLWLATEGKGVARYDGNRVEAIERGKKITEQDLHDLKKSNGQFVKSFTNFSTEHGLASNDVRCIIEDKAGNLWFGTAGGGVSCYNGNTASIMGSKRNEDGQATFTNFTVDQGLANNMVLNIHEDRKGHLWFVTYGGGISRYDGKYFTNFTTTHGLPSNDAIAISEDEAGNIWIGTDGGGVSRYDGKTFITYNTGDGLPDNTVTQIVIPKISGAKEFASGVQKIVIATNLGLAVFTSFSSKFVQKEVSKISSVNNLNNQQLKNYRPEIEIYNSTTGYPVKDVNLGSNCLFEDSKGILWIATGADKTALVRFDYSSLNKNSHPPTVVIKNIKINEENICWYNFNTEDSMVNAQQEIMTYGSLLSKEVRDSLTKKFSDIKFDGISNFYPIPRDLKLPYRHNHVTFEFNAIEPARPYLVKYQYMLVGYDNKWSPVTNKTDVSYGNINEGNYTFKLKAQSPFGIWSEPVTYSFSVLPPWWRTWWAYSIYAIVFGLSVVLYIRYRTRRLIERQRELENEVDHATSYIKKQKEIVETAHYELQGKNKEIMDSIAYAKRIQTAILPPPRLVKEFLKNSFILYLPKDIVAGDFYWLESIDNKIYFAACDCTGHGVPGAMVSVVCNNALNRALNEFGKRTPGELFDKARELVMENFARSDEEVQDGMDASLAALDIKERKLLWAGANNSLWIIRKNKSATGSGGRVEEIKADKQPIGKGYKSKPFTTREIQLYEGDMIYLFTDGYADQFGGSAGKKMTKAKFREFLLSVCDLPMDDQQSALFKFHQDYRGKEEQVDDITLLGVRV